MVSGVQNIPRLQHHQRWMYVPDALQDEEMEEWMVAPEEFHQHSDSQAYADNVRPCAEMLFAALLEVHTVATTTCTACDSAIGCGSLAVCQLLLYSWQRLRRPPSCGDLMTCNLWLCLCPPLSQAGSCALWQPGAKSLMLMP